MSAEQADILAPLQCPHCQAMRYAAKENLDRVIALQQDRDRLERGMAELGEKLKARLYGATHWDGCEKVHWVCGILKEYGL